MTLYDGPTIPVEAYYAPPQATPVPVQRQIVLPPDVSLAETAPLPVVKRNRHRRSYRDEHFGNLLMLIFAVFVFLVALSVPLIWIFFGG